MAKKVLLIDDHYEIRTAIEYLLENAERDYKVFACRTADEGLNLLRENPEIQVIILDIIMPVKNGIQTLFELKSRTDNLRIIVLTGYPGKFDADKAKELGVFYYLPKPPDEEPLIFAIEAAFDDLRTKGILGKNAFFLKENDYELTINDRWIMNRLNKNIDYSVFGVKRLEPLSKEVMYDVYNFEDDPFSIWFSQRTFYEIFEKRIFPVFEIAGMKYIKEALKTFLKFERLTYITPFFSENKRSRDHFLHQFRIAILGDFILNCYIGSQKDKRKLIDLVIRNLNLKGTGSENHTLDQVRITWWVTALLHDCSYPLYHIFFPDLFQKSPYEELNRIYSDVFLEDFRKSFDDALKNFNKKFKTKLDGLISDLGLEDFQRHILKSFENKYSHNISSAFNLWEMLKDSNNNAFLPKLAVKSIILHHNFLGKENSDKEKKISLLDYPLAFLLIVLDEMQEWGRPIVVEDDHNPTKISKLVELDKVTIQGIQRIEKGEYCINKDKLTFILNYKDRGKIIERTKLDPGQKYEEKKNNLKRLVIGSGDMPKIEVQMNFPTFDPKPILIE